MTFRLSTLIFAILMIVIPAFAEIPNLVNEYGKNFIQSVNRVRVNHMEATNGLPAKYENDLKLLGVRFQKAGDLEGVLAVKREITRFQKAFEGERDPFEAVPEMPKETIVSSPAALRSLQINYVGSFSKARKTRKSALLTLNRKFIAQLGEMQKESTRDGRIQEAISIRDRIDQISAFLKKGDYAGLVSAFPAFGTLPKLTSVAKKKSPSDHCNGKTGWRAWHYFEKRLFSKDFPRLFVRGLPDDIQITYRRLNGRGRMVGVSRSSTRQVGCVFCEWFGNSVLWKIDSIDDLPVVIRLKARNVTKNVTRGPQVQLAVFADGKRKKILNVPLYIQDDVIRIARDKNNPNRFALYWPYGRQTEMFELPDHPRNLAVMLGVSLNERGEECDVFFQLQDEPR